MRNVKILVAPLDWGLGHVTRCIPIINELTRSGCEVWIAADGAGSALLRAEFPFLNFLDLKGYGVFYHSIKYMVKWKIFSQIPRIKAAIRHENKWLKQVLLTHHFDAIISDNRFGLYHPAIFSVFITHQLYIKSGAGKWVDSIIQKINYRYIAHFNECWVPDYEETRNLSGELSHGSNAPGNIHYIGPLSRLKKMDTSAKYDLLIILSGPEPSRTAWEQLLLVQLSTYKRKALLIRGLPGVCACEAPPGSATLQIINHLPSPELNLAIAQSDWVVCRSGYSSVMDFAALGQKAILVPTPGQPEQEYLAGYLKEQGLFYTTTQDAFSIKESIAEAERFEIRLQVHEQVQERYKERIDALITAIHLKKSQKFHGAF
jgi:hypothetical protein